MDSIAIEDLLAGLGFGSAQAQARARRALEEAGLTRPGKRRIALEKRGRVEEVLARRFARACPDPACQEEARASGREVLTTDRSHCEVCRGSSVRRAVQAMADALARRGLQRLLVVGGTQEAYRTLRDALPREVDLRWVDGTRAPDPESARALLRWADLVVIWASTPLPHKVSALYLRKWGCLRVARRGVGSLAQAVLCHLEGDRG